MKRYSKSGLFLLELMLSLLIFSVCAAICMGLFGKAAADTAKSRDLNSAVILARNVAELVKSGEKIDAVSYYDGELSAAESVNSAYSAVVTYETPELFNVDIIRTVDGETVFALSCAK